MPNETNNSLLVVMNPFKVERLPFAKIFGASTAQEEHQGFNLIYWLIKSFRYLSRSTELDSVPKFEQSNTHTSYDLERFGNLREIIKLSVLYAESREQVCDVTLVNTHVDE